MLVRDVDVALLSFELPRPIYFGTAAYRRREYVAVQVRTEEPELSGFGLGYTRGSALFDSVALLTDDLIGLDATRPRAVARKLAAGRRAAQAAMVRASSLLEIASWDILAKAARLPLSIVAGGARSEIPALAVCGYYPDVKGRDGIAADAAALEAQGFSAIKLMVDAQSAAITRELVACTRQTLRDETVLGIDLHYSLADRPDAFRVMQELDDLGLSFIEDPLPPSHAVAMAQWAERLRTPLALGEDVTSPWDYDRLLSPGSILRIDPTTCGGFSAALSGLELARLRGHGVIPHGIHGVSAQLAAAHDQVSLMEFVPSELSHDLLGEVLEEPFALRRGAIVVDDEPGNGLRLDWPSVEERAVRSWTTRH